PPGAFLQAGAEAEAWLQTRVGEAIRGATRVADLFCGVGTFALTLDGRMAVTAMDSDRASVDALNLAAGRAGRPVTAEPRDLFAHPPSTDELGRFDAVIFDPPRAGAQALATALAQS